MYDKLISDIKSEMNKCSNTRNPTKCYKKLNNELVEMEQGRAKFRDLI